MSVEERTARANQTEAWPQGFQKSVINLASLPHRWAMQATS
jgi:hypothetical protein